MVRTMPPFRADHVGSFLRPPALKDARARRERGEITAAALAEIEDREIEALIGKQEAVGLKLATDGEFRRSFWQFDFFGLLDGVEIDTSGPGIQFRGVATRPIATRITGKIGFSDHPFVRHFAFLKAHTRVVPKMTIPAPTVMHFRQEPHLLDGAHYKRSDDILDDLAQAYRQAVRAFYDAGCRYLQFDDTAWAYLCSAEEIAKAKARGVNTSTVVRDYAALINAALADKPDDMVVTTHICRGNFRSTWIASGGYEPVAEVLFGGTNFDGYFLEYDSERAGGFEPLRFVPKGDKQVVLGLITSKTGTLERKSDIKRRLEEASQFIALEQCCLSPQCGFASTEEGNTLTEQQQWAKMREVVEIAEEVWGG